MDKIAKNQTGEVTLTVNGRRYEGQAQPRTLLVDFLRHQLKLYGTHVGCEHGICGACTILLNGQAVRSCTLYAVQVDGEEIETIEGLSDGEMLSVLQKSFQKHHGLQCGFCTPGILMSSEHFLKETPSPSEEEVRDMLSGHICRCTGYEGIVRSILDAAAILRGDQP
ncbi:MAG: (2Fe-2S)-binding protein [Rhodospirillaceae bacterium]|jgi:aerobic-type carbon monoxide dehydrogenase small subunit (CoxS/CutS family)|nr:(2Fe-2S)-binding protein [Rhodospirillaceae bacterium]|tara:strand:- start:202 stop:702 length:501 start_codon:yes stop_codon:yes gene_type:complete